jgi:hypothetical protein
MRSNPVFGKNSVGDAQDVRPDSVHWVVFTPEAAVDHHVVALGDDQAGLVAQRRRQALDQVEVPVAARRDVRRALALGLKDALTSGAASTGCRLPGGQSETFDVREGSGSPIGHRVASDGNATETNPSAADDSSGQDH